MNFIKKAISAIGLLIDAGIYSLINSVYKIYMILAQSKIINSKMFIEISNRFYAVIGIAMLFFLSYVIIQGIISPDTFSSKSGGEGSAIIKRVLIAVLGIALVPGIFRMAYTGQEIILEEDVIGKIFMGYGNNSINTSGVNVENLKVPDSVELEDGAKESGGTLASISVWRTVFRPNLETENSADAKTVNEQIDEKSELIKANLTEVNGFLKGAGAAKGAICAIGLIAGGIAAFITAGVSLAAGMALCAGSVAADAYVKSTESYYQASNKIKGHEDGKITLKEAYVLAATTGNFMIFTCFADAVASGEITFNWLASIVIGIAVLYLFLSFSIDMAVRAVKLSYMEIIAPIPLMLQIMPKFKDNFQKWLKTTISLFIEVFLRLTFIYVVLFLLTHLDYILAKNVFKGANLSGGEYLLGQVILIIGLLLFAKTAPQFISETLGISSGNLNLGLRQKLSESGVLGIAAGAGRIGGALGQGLGSGIKDIVNGAKNGVRGNKGLGSRILGASRGVFGGLGRTISNTVRAVPKAANDIKNTKSFGDITKAAKEGSSATRDRIERAYATRAKKDEAKKNAREKWNAKYEAENDKLPGRFHFGRFMAATGATFAIPYKELYRNANAGLADPSKYAAEAAVRQLEAKREQENLRKAGLESTEIANDSEVAKAQERLNLLNAPDAVQRMREAHSGESDEKIAARLAEEKRNATEALAKAKDSALQRKVNETALTGKYNDVTRRMAAYINDHRDALKKLSSFQFGEGENRKTFGEEISRIFGEGALKGHISFDGALHLGNEQEIRLRMDKDTFRVDRNGAIQKLGVDGQFEDFKGGLAELRKLAEKAEKIDSSLVASGKDGINRGLSGLERDGSDKISAIVETDKDGKSTRREFEGQKASTLAEGTDVYLSDGTKVKVSGGAVEIAGETDTVTINGGSTKVKREESKLVKKASGNVTISDDGLKELLAGGSIVIDGKKYYIDTDGKLAEENTADGTVTTKTKTEGRTEVDAELLRKLAKKAGKDRISGLRAAADSEDKEYNVIGNDTTGELRREETTVTDITQLDTVEDEMVFTSYGEKVIVKKQLDGKYTVKIGSEEFTDLTQEQVAEKVDDARLVYIPSATSTAANNIILSEENVRSILAESAPRELILSTGEVVDVTVDGFAIGKDKKYKTIDELVKAHPGAKITQVTREKVAESDIKGLIKQIQAHIDKEGSA